MIVAWISFKRGLDLFEPSFHMRIIMINNIICFQQHDTVKNVEGSLIPVDLMASGHRERACGMRSDEI